MIRPTSWKSSACSPRVASAGDPTRRPLETMGGRGSNGTALRLTVIPMSASRSSACFPSSSDSRRSTTTRCTSVPPVRTLTPWPAPRSSSPTAWAPVIVRRWRSRKVSVAASLSATALPAITCSSGPPCWPGNTAELSFFAMASSLARIMPPRAPPIVLWMVVVTTWECGTGLGWRSAATSPAKWAMSVSRIAPTSSAISRNSGKSSWRGYADQPAMISLGRCSAASRTTSSMSTRPSSRRTWYGMTSYRRPEMFLAMPCVR